MQLIGAYSHSHQVNLFPFTVPLPFISNFIRIPSVAQFELESTNMIQITGDLHLCVTSRQRAKGNESVPILLAQCLFRGLAISNAKI